MEVEKITSGIPKKPRERWPWVLYQFRLRGIGLQAVADELGITKQAVYNVAHVGNRRVQEAIAKKLGVEPENLWPERYRHNSTTRSVRRNGKKAAPASHQRTEAA